MKTLLLFCASALCLMAQPSGSVVQSADTTVCASVYHVAAPCVASIAVLAGATPHTVICAWGKTPLSATQIYISEYCSNDGVAFLSAGFVPRTDFYNAQNVNFYGLQVSGYFIQQGTQVSWFAIAYNQFQSGTF